MTNVAEHALINSLSSEHDTSELEVTRYECTNCFNISTQCLIDVCPHCGESLKERALRPSELIEVPEKTGHRTVNKEDETQFNDFSKLA